MTLRRTSPQGALADVLINLPAEVNLPLVMQAIIEPLTALPD